MIFGKEVMPRDRIELPTRGFSMPIQSTAYQSCWPRKSVEKQSELLQSLALVWPKQRGFGGVLQLVPGMRRNLIKELRSENTDYPAFEARNI